MTLNQLRYFCTAVRCHSITQAAKLLFVTQPAVSIAIRDLEKEFSITLFSYTKNRLELTKEGEAFYEQAVRLLEMSDEMQAQFHDSSRYRPVVEIIYRTGKTDIEVHMRMNVHSTRKHIFSACVDDFSIFSTQAASNFDNLFSVNQDVTLKYFRISSDHSVFYQLFHVGHFFFLL